MKKPLILCILDGCGMREEQDGNAFKNAYKPTFDRLWNEFPHCLLDASGPQVGLPPGQIGTSEVGHMTIGAGRVVYQPLEIINQRIEDGTFEKNEVIKNVLSHVKDRDSKLHIMGLLSDGGVHSHIDQLFALMHMIETFGIKKICYHIFTDGRDTSPKSALQYIDKLERELAKIGHGSIVTISGRYYPMDRDNNYDRVKLAYDAIVNGTGHIYSSSKEMVEKNYANGITDEFFKPGLLSYEPISSGDGIITFNFRQDRLRELFTALTNPDNSPLKTKDLTDLAIATMFEVSSTVLCPHAFEHPDFTNNLGEYLYKNRIPQLRIAETEKYAHVTFFFDGAIEKDYDTMKKILIPSPKVATYDLKPEMSVEQITDSLIECLEEDIYEVIILNFANGDMVGHTGNYDAAILAVEAMDRCLTKIYDKVCELDGTLLITADHGNCDIMWNEDKIPVTSHTLSKVPFILCRKGYFLKDGNLSNIAPTILDLMNLVKPKEMTSNSLIQK